jgi:hypothetical protein
MSKDIARAKGDDADARNVTKNVSAWAQSIDTTLADILNYAILCQSIFVIDFSIWLCDIIIAMLTMSAASACDRNLQERIRAAVEKLVRIFHELPEGMAAVGLMESAKPQERLLDIGVKAHKIGDIQLGRRVLETLIGWGFKAGRNGNSWGSFAASLEAAVALSMELGVNMDGLIKTIAINLEESMPVESRILNSTAKTLRDKARSLSECHNGLTNVDRLLGRHDHNVIGETLLKIANVLVDGIKKGDDPPDSK